MRPVSRAPAARVVWAVPALLVVLAACGGADTKQVSGESAGQGSGAAIQTSEPETAVDDNAGAEEDPAGDAGDGSAGEEGTWDERTLVPAMKAAMVKQETAHVFMTTNAQDMKMRSEGDVAFRGDRQDMALTMDGAAMGVESVEIRMVDKVVYLSMPPLTPQGKFVEIRPGDKSSPFAGMAGEMQVVDPRDTFAALESGLRKVTYVGDESVRGEDMEHYRLTVDFRAAAKAQGLPRTAGPRTVAYDMWLDDDALMRRVEFDLMRQVSLVMEMSDWGEPVTINAPARKDIVQAPGR